MPWSPEQRRALDEVQRGLTSVYRYLLWLLILLVTGIAVFLFTQFQHDASRGFLNLYGGVAYLTFLGWAFGRLRSLRPGPPERPLFDANLGRDENTGAWEFSFHVGAPEPGAAPGAGERAAVGGTRGPGSTAREAGPLPGWAVAVVFSIVLAGMAVALLLALWTLGYVPWPRN